jgi:hypothetical protein
MKELLTSKTNPRESPMKKHLYLFVLVAAFTLPSAAFGATCPDACDTLGGDVNTDGQVNVADLIAITGYLYRGESICTLGADANGDGRIDIGDWITIHTFLYQGGPAPVDPFCLECPTACDAIGGDVNGDGGVDVADAVTFNDWLQGGEMCESAADVNQDGGIDIADFSLLYGWLAGSSSTLLDPVCSLSGR